MNEIASEMAGKMDKLSLDFIYVLRKAISQYLKNTLTSLHKNFGSADRQRLFANCQKLLSSPSHFPKESELQVALNGLTLQLIIEEAGRLLDGLLECILLEVEHFFSDLLKQRLLDSALDNHKQMDCLGSMDLPMDIVDFDDADGLDGIMLNSQIDDPRLRQFLIFGFCAQLFHPAWAHPQRIQLYSDIHFKVLYWRAISQKQHIDDFLMIDRIQQISLGHSSSIWARISNRE
jgi:hypothetical protein